MKDVGSLHGINISRALAITHLLFVDDIIIFRNCSMEEWNVLHKIFNTFCCATGMMINFDKSLLLSHQVNQGTLEQILALFPTQTGDLEHDLKYLGYFIKENCYRLVDWRWILGNIDKRIKSRCNKFISIGGRLVLIKSVLSSILVYWFTLAQLPVGVIEALRKLLVNYLWGDSDSHRKIHLVAWHKIFLPKKYGGWGIKHPFWFNVALCIKSGWRMLTGIGLWHDVIFSKYLNKNSLEQWL